jgi:hypothetical protein
LTKAGYQNTFMVYDPLQSKNHRFSLISDIVILK